MKTPEFLVGVNAEGTAIQMDAQAKRALAVWIKTLAGEKAVLTLKKKVARRSIPANARYWALLTVAAESLWGDASLKDDLHNELAHLLLPLPACPKTGMRRREHTPNLNSPEFQKYVERAQDKLIELGADLSGFDDELRRIAA